MPYRKTVFATNYFYHVYNRGVAKQPIFIDNQDKFVFLKKLHQYRRKNSLLSKKETPLVSLHVFCLMPNHFHLIIRQETEGGIISFLRKLGTSYVMYFNKKYNRVGPLFQGRFQAKLIDKDEYIIHLARYIHLNPFPLLTSPVKLKNYPFTSLSAYLGLRNIPFLNKNFIYGYFNNSPKEIEDFTFSGISQPVPGFLTSILLE